MTTTPDFPWAWLIWISGIVVAVGGASNIIVRLANPFRALKLRVDKHDALFEKDNNRLKDEEACTTAMLRAIYALLEHTRTNNSTGLVDTASKELHKFLIERK